MCGPSVWRVEEACFNAFPALKHVILEGWLLRFSEGQPRRTNNSVSPMRADCANVAAVIDAIESVYQRNGVPTLFRVPAFMAEACDASLAAHGYSREEDSCVIYGDIAAVGAVPDAQVELSPSANIEWLAAMGDLQGYSQEQRAAGNTSASISARSQDKCLSHYHSRQRSLGPRCRFLVDFLLRCQRELSPIERRRE